MVLEKGKKKWMERGMEGRKSLLLPPSPLTGSNHILPKKKDPTGQLSDLAMVQLEEHRPETRRSRLAPIPIS